MSEEGGGGLACINPQPGGPGDFWSRFSSSSPWHVSIKPQGSSASFGPPRVFHFPGTRHIWWAFLYPPPGEAPGGRLATPHGVQGISFKISRNTTIIIGVLLYLFVTTCFGPCFGSSSGQKYKLRKLYNVSHRKHYVSLTLYNLLSSYLWRWWWPKTGAETCRHLK